MALWTALAAIMATAGGPRARRTALRSLLAAGLGDLVATLVLKRLFRRKRPDMSLLPLVRTGGRAYTSGSFPSGHTAAAVGFAGGVAADAPRLLSAPVVLLAGAVAFSRVHSGAHYPGDVAGGLAVGAAAAYAAQRMLPPRPELALGARTMPEATAEVAQDGRGVVAVVNPGAAEGGVSWPVKNSMGERIEQALPEARVVEAAPDEGLPDVLDGAARECAILAVAGGDGTVNAGARAALRHGRPLLVLPDGTLNHFASTLGLTSFTAVMRAYRQGSLARVDVGLAEGELSAGRSVARAFVNTASVGAYPRLVDHRDGLQPRLGKWLAFAAALRHVLREAEPIEVLIDGRRFPLWWAFVGNCRYRTHAMAPGMRERMEDGDLDIRVLAAREPFPKLRAVADVVLGRWGLGHGYLEWNASEVTIVSCAESLRLALDGETFTGPAALTLSKKPGALRVFVPARRRRARVPRPRGEATRGSTRRG